MFTEYPSFPMFISQFNLNITITSFRISQNTDNSSRHLYMQTYKAVTDCKIQPVSQKPANRHHASMQPLAVASVRCWYFVKCKTATARRRHWKSIVGDGDRSKHLHDRGNIYMLWAAFGGDVGDRSRQLLPPLVATVATKGSWQHVNVPSTGKCSHDLPCMQSSPPMGTCHRSTATVATLAVLHWLHSTVRPHWLLQFCHLKWLRWQPPFCFIDIDSNVTQKEPLSENPCS